MSDEKPTNDGNPPAPNPPAPPTPAVETPETHTFTQDELNRYNGRLRAEARRAMEKEVADQLGVPVAEAKAVLEARQKAEEDALGEVEKARRAAETSGRAAEEKMAQAEALILRTRVERLLLGQVVSSNAVGDVADLVKVEKDASDEDVQAAIDALKGRLPVLFVADGAGAPVPPPSSATGLKPPAAKPPTSDASKDAFERGQNFMKQPARLT